MEWAKFIQEAGVTVAALVACGAFIKYMFDKYTETLQNITQAHADEMKEQREVIGKLSDSVDQMRQELTARMDAWERRSG